MKKISGAIFCKAYQRLSDSLIHAMTILIKGEIRRMIKWSSIGLLTGHSVANRYGAETSKNGKHGRNVRIEYGDCTRENCE